MTLFPINEIAKKRGCIVGYDEERKSSIVDEDKLLDSIEEDLEKGGLIIDWHVCDIFPERLIDLVVVLRAETSTLYDRYKSRDYPENKLQENLDSEIMEVVLQEAVDSYAPEIVIELHSDNVDEMEENVERIVQWKSSWQSNA